MTESTFKLLIGMLHLYDFIIARERPQEHRTHVSTIVSISKSIYLHASCVHVKDSVCDCSVKLDLCV